MQFSLRILEFDGEAFYVSTQRGHIKLLHGGFAYTQRGIRDEVTTKWRCAKRKPQCKGKAITIKIGEKHFVKVLHFHNHLPDPADESYL